MEDNRRKNFLSHYYCRNYKTTSNNCSPHKIKTSELNHLVLQTILMQVRLVLDLEKAINKLKNNGKEKEIESNYNTNMEMLGRYIDKYKRLKKKSYEDLKLNSITKEEYEMYSIDYDKKIENYTNEIKVVQKIYKENLQNIKKDNYWIEHFKKNKKIKTLSREIIYELIDCIYVHEGGNMTIKFKCQDEFEEAIKFVKENRDIILAKPVSICC